MNKPICSVDVCDRPHYARGWCNAHYLQWLKKGHVTDGPIRSRSARPEGDGVFTEEKCVEAPGHGSYHRRGSIRVAGDKVYPVSQHRMAYELYYGPILDGLVVRHTCDNPPCVNPLHLKVGTYADNTRDAMERGRMRNQNTGKTECVAGHPLEGDNLVPSALADGRRACRECSRQRARESNRRKRVAAQAGTGMDR